MAKPNEFASVLIDVGVGADVAVEIEDAAEAETRAQLAVPDSEEPFRILVLGDFSGRASHQPMPPLGQAPLLIDRDNFDEVMARLHVELNLGGAGARQITLSFRELDDFHPDRIYQSHDLFKPFRDARAKLTNPATFAEAASEVGAWSALTPPVAAPAQLDLSRLSNGSSLLDDIVEAAGSEAPASAGIAGSSDPLHAFIQQSMPPHLQPRESPELPALLAQVDESAAKLMRAILHHQDFQALEAAWRAMFFLIRGLETGTQLKVYLLDISKRELAADLSVGSLRHCSMGKVLMPSPSAGSDEGGWALVAAQFSFDKSTADVETLSCLSRLMSGAGTPFLAEADLGGKSTSADEVDAWDRLRRSREAACLGLAVPRFLARLPYGAETEELESFRFEEMPGTPIHREYLWANPSMICAYLLGEAFSARGWNLETGDCHDVSNLPLHIFTDGDEKRLRPCVELVMTPSDVEWALDEGYMPLVWQPDEASVRIARFQAIAEPPARLAGRWG